MIIEFQLIIYMEMTHFLAQLLFLICREIKVIHFLQYGKRDGGLIEQDNLTLNISKMTRLLI